MTVLPYGRSGGGQASMLALGRALGETVAVLSVPRSAARPGDLVARRRLYVRFQDRSAVYSANRCRPVYFG